MSGNGTLPGSPAARGAGQGQIREAERDLGTQRTLRPAARECPGGCDPPARRVGGASCPGGRSRPRRWALLAAALLLAGWALLTFRVNRALPPARLITAGPNEPLPCGGDLVTLQSAWLAETGALWQACGLAADAPLPERTLLCALTVCRGGAEPAETGENAAGEGAAGIAPLRCWTAASEGWGEMTDTGRLFEALNPGVPLPEQLAPGTRQTYLVPVALWQAAFSPRHWQRLDESGFRLQLSVYPVGREFRFIPEPMPESPAGLRR